MLFLQTAIIQYTNQHQTRVISKQRWNDLETSVYFHMLRILTSDVGCLHVEANHGIGELIEYYIILKILLKTYYSALSPH